MRLAVSSSDLNSLQAVEEEPRSASLALVTSERDGLSPTRRSSGCSRFSLGMKWTRRRRASGKARKGIRARVSKRGFSGEEMRGELGLGLV
tara:strand:- start:6294 stop:6566 length:273 start_codon:yes stop_codon:yes gene_type:complete